ncbi:MAG TPA: peptidoglycan DD-metalloendopeptidase family protein [Clostridiaceae bacterium]
MDKKLINKSSNFFKREGFYVILFVCLCIVATAAVLATKTKTGSLSTKNQAKAQTKNETPIVADVPTTEVQNALEVKDATNNTNVAAVTPTPPKTAAVATAIDTTFAKPVEGNVVRAYSEDPVKWNSSSSAASVTYRPNFGIDIKADLGKPVVAVMDGIVKEVKSDQDGVQITIQHPQNGLKTVYANLDAKVSVIVGQSIKKGGIIGKIGGTTIRAAYEDYGKNYLHFGVVKDNNYVDPAKYIKY